MKQGVSVLVEYIGNKELSKLEEGNSIKCEYIGVTKKLRGRVIKGKFIKLERSNKGHIYLVVCEVVNGGVEVHLCRWDEFNISRTRLSPKDSEVLSKFIEHYLYQLQEKEEKEVEEKLKDLKRYENGRVRDLYCGGLFGRVYDLGGALITKIGYEKNSEGRDVYWVEVLKGENGSQERDVSRYLSREGIEHLLSTYCHRGR